jgi:hypothetical protein
MKREEINMNLNYVRALISDLEYEVKKIGIHNDPEYCYSLKLKIDVLTEEEEMLIGELKFLGEDY